MNQPSINPKHGVLYISYSGMLEPLGQSQVLAYQERLSAGRPIHLMSFERTSDWQKTSDREAMAARMTAAGIQWHPLRYHKKLSILATAWDVLAGAYVGWQLVRKHGLGLIHARSYVPSAMALLIKRLTRTKYLFDMRGFWADERVDGGLWPRDRYLYKIAKWLERRFLLGADHVVSLTHAAIREMEGFDYLCGRMPPMTVIPTCADLERFRPLPRPSRVDAPFTLGYVGSAGTWYLFDEVVACFSELRRIRPDARFLVINRNEHAYIRERLEAGGVSPDQVEIKSAAHSEVPEYISQMDAGIFFIQPVFSKQASAPTKLGEFLGCGVPCLSNQGVGDMARVLEGDEVGIALANFDSLSLQEGVVRLLALTEQPDIVERCSRSARKHFSLDEGVARYRRIYQSLEEAG